jgi:hypothetical protein
MRLMDTQVVPTPFQRAVVGALVIIAEYCLPETHRGFTDQDLGAAHRAIDPFLDETPREPAAEIPDAAIGLTPSPHRHDWVQYTLPNGAILASCSFCSAGTQLR